MTQYEAITDLAMEHYGLVTSAEAAANGVRVKDMAEWVKLGRLEKCGRGVYRLVHYVPTEYDRYAEAIAHVGEGAMVWGQSVLAMHNLALVNPPQIDVACARRVRRSLPKWIRLVKTPAGAKAEEFNGIRCQSLAQALRDARGSVMTERLATAVREAGMRGLLGAGEFEELKKEFGA